MPCTSDLVDQLRRLVDREIFSVPSFSAVSAVSALSLAVSWSAAGPSSSGTISSSENTFDWSEPFSDSSSFRLSAMRRTGADGLLDVFTIDGVCFRISILDLSRCEFTPYSSSLSVPVPSAISTPAS